MRGTQQPGMNEGCMLLLVFRLSTFDSSYFPQEQLLWVFIEFPCCSTHGVVNRVVKHYLNHLLKWLSFIPCCLLRQQQLACWDLHSGGGRAYGRWFCCYGEVHWGLAPLWSFASDGRFSHSIMNQAFQSGCCLPVRMPGGWSVFDRSH